MVFRKGAAIRGLLNVSWTSGGDGRYGGEMHPRGWKVSPLSRNACCKVGIYIFLGLHLAVIRETL